MKPLYSLTWLFALCDFSNATVTGFTMDFVDITGGVVADDTGYGAVGNDYRMGKYEVSRGMIEAYNSAADGGPDITLADMTGYGGNGTNRPATGVSWNGAARFVNWLNTSSGYPAAYNFTTDGGNDNITLWTSGDAGYDAYNPFRNSQSYYFLPSEDEWYRAAYYDPSANGGAGGYWDYATGSDSAPIAVANGTTSGTAVWHRSLLAGPANVEATGGLSAFGTMGQGGNAWEWLEDASSLPNDLASEDRLARGGFWGSSLAHVNSNGLASYSPRAEQSPAFVDMGRGFRVASIAPVPEPSGAILTLVGMMSFVLRRKRCARN